MITLVKRAAAVTAAALAVSAAVHPKHASSATSATSPSQNTAAAKAIAYATAQIGKPYIYGGPTSPGTSAGFDCSGLVMEAYKAAGVTLPRTSEEQWAQLAHVTSPQPGDLVFFAGADGTPAKPGHVGIYLKRNTILDAYATGTDIRIESYNLPASAGGLDPAVGYARP